MTGKSEVTSLFQIKTSPTVASRRPGADATPSETDEEACAAYGYMRGIRDRSLAIEFRYRDGNSDFYPYSWLGPWRYNPSAGLLLKFTGDVTTLVLIRGSNLDALVNQSINLTDRGIARHRISWLKEMDEDALRMVGKGQPTIDRIEVGEFQSHEEAQEWLKKAASVFVRGTA
jgi:hypothetical protein